MFLENYNEGCVLFFVGINVHLYKFLHPKASLICDTGKSNKMKFKIPAKPYISKFVLSKNGNVLVANRKSPDGFFLLTLLKNKTNCKDDLEFQDRLQSYVSIEVSQKQISNNRFKGFSAEATRLFHRKYTVEFEETFYNHMDVMRELDIPIKSGILNFIEIYQLAESVTYEGLKRKYYRHRQSKLKESA